MSGVYITVNRFNPSTYDVSKFYFKGKNIAMALPPNVASMSLEIPEDVNANNRRKYLLNQKHSFLWNKIINKCKL